MKYKKSFAGIALLGMAILFVAPRVFADAPVVDLSQDSQNTVVAQTTLDSPPTGQDGPPSPMMPEKNIQAQAQTPSTGPQASMPVAMAGPIPAAAPSQPEVDLSKLSTEQRLKRLEQQINNLVEMHLPARLDSMQLEVAKLHGDNEQAKHDLKAMSDQLRDFYVDLTRRIGGQPQTVPPTANNGSSMQTQSTTLSSAPAAMATPEVDQQNVPKEQKMYDEALNLLQQKKYADASVKMSNYLKAYPNGAYAVNAHYWLGESHYLLNQFDLAAIEFKLLLNKYPKSTKSADSLLKLGIIHNSLGKRDEARRELAQVQKRFPGSTQAQLARQQLASMPANSAGIYSTPKND